MWIRRTEFERLIARAEQAEETLRLLRADIAHWRKVAVSVDGEDNDWAIGVRDVIEALSDRVIDDPST